MTTALIVGFVSSLALIAAIGAQNAFVLRQGIRGEHVGAVVALCIVSDVLLISAGVAGFGALVGAFPAVVTVATVGGAAFLIGYGLLAARRAVRPGTLAVGDTAAATLPAVLGGCAAITFLNPHVYLDTVILLGALAAEHADSRWWFAAGAASASAVWFSALGAGAQRLSGVLTSVRAQRVLEAVVATTMISLGIAVATR